MANKENTAEGEKKGVGIWEVITGILGGIAAFAIVAETRVKGVVDKLQVIANAATKDAEALYRQNFPQTNIVTPEDAEKWKNGLSNAVHEAADPTTDKMWDMTNPIKRHVVAFAQSDIKTKVTIGVITTVAALGVAWVVNALRNRKSHADQETDRRQATDQSAGRSQG
jgi:hypothetical protein